MSRSTLTVVAVAVLFLLALGFRSLRAVGADDQQTDTIVSLARQEKAIAEESLKVVTNLEVRGQIDPGSGVVPRWSRRLVEATRKSGVSHAEIVDALKLHVARMDNRVEVVKRLLEAAKVTHLDLLNAKYEALEARSWLLEQDRN